MEARSAIRLKIGVQRSDVLVPDAVKERVQLLRQPAHRLPPYRHQAAPLEVLEPLEPEALPAAVGLETRWERDVAPLSFPLPLPLESVEPRREVEPSRPCVSPFFMDLLGVKDAARGGQAWPQSRRRGKCRRRSVAVFVDMRILAALIMGIPVLIHMWIK